jgi:hypothetical protein
VNGLTTVNLGHGLTAGTVGIDSSNSGTGGITINHTAGTLAAGTIGINAVETGNGNVAVSQTGGALNGTTQAVNATTTGTGTVLVSITGGTVGTTTGTTINAASTTGTNTVTANTAITSTGGVGINATSTTGTITVDGTGAVSGTTGINAVASGAGNVGVTQGGAVTGTTGVGVNATSAGGNVQVATGSTITGATTGVNAATTGAGTVTVTSGGAITGTAATGITTSAATGLTTITANHNVSGATDGINATATTGNISVTNAATLMGGTNAVAGTTTGLFDITNNSVMTGAVNVTSAAGSTFTNNGTWNAGTGASSYTGSLVNPGTVNVGSGGTITIGTNMTNSGLLNMQNGTTDNNVTVTGIYNGAGGTVNVDANLAGSVADTLTVGAGSTGSTVVVNTTAFGATAFTPVIIGGAGDGFVLTNLPVNGIFFAQQVEQGGNVGIQTNINLGAASSIASNISGALAAVASGFHQPSSNFVTSKPRAEPNEPLWGIWARGDAGRFHTLSTTDLSLNGSRLNSFASKQRLEYEGVQSGADMAILNMGGSGWNSHFGVSGGYVTAGVRQLNGEGNSDVDTPFVSAYAFFTNGSATLDFTVRRDFHQIEFTNAAAGLARKNVDGSGLSAAAVGSYRMNIGGNFFLTPAAGITWTETKVDDFAFNNGIISARDDSSLLGRIGLQLAYLQKVTDTFFVLPFVNVSRWRNFENATDLDIVTQFANNPALTFNTETRSVRDFTQLSVGLAANETTSQMTGYVQGTWREGDGTGTGIQGGSVTVGGRINF